MVVLDQAEPGIGLDAAEEAGRVKRGTADLLAVGRPDQIEPVNAAYAPSDAELAQAERIVRAFTEAEARGEAAVQVDGQMVDYPVAYRAQALLESAGRKS